MIHIVTEALAPFVYEAPLIIGMPQGSKFDARFSSKWVDDHLFESSDNFLSSEGILSLRDWETGTIIPIRKIVINGVKLIGNFVYIDYEISDYIFYATIPELRERQLEGYNSHLKDHFKDFSIQNNPAKPMSKLVFKTKDIAWREYSKPVATNKNDIPFERWQITVEELSNVDALKGYPFLKYELIRPETGTIIDCKEGSFSVSRRWKVSIRCMYIITKELASDESKFRSPKDIHLPLGTLELQIKSSSLGSLIPIHKHFLDGRYDRFDVDFFASKDLGSSRDSLALSISATETFKDIALPSFKIPIRYKQTDFIRIFAVTLLFAFYLTLTLYSSIESILSIRVKGFLEDLTLIILVLQVSFLVKSKMKLS